MPAKPLIALLLAVGGVARAQDAAKTWDFQNDKVDEAPAGFSFGKADSVTHFDALSVKPLQ